MSVKKQSADSLWCAAARPVQHVSAMETRSHLGRIPPPDGLQKRAPPRVCGPLVPAAEGDRSACTATPASSGNTCGSAQTHVHGRCASAAPRLMQMRTNIVDLQLRPEGGV